MIDYLIDDLDKALDHNCYFAALSLALALPDICGRAEYPDLSKSSKQRYIAWYDNYIGKYERPPESFIKNKKMKFYLI